MTRRDPDPYAVLGVPSDASAEEITAAYRRAVRASHPDTERPDPKRLAEVIAAYRRLRDGERSTAPTARRSGGVPIPVRVHRPVRDAGPELRAGPVRRHRHP